jgi:hypothetical protein
VRRPAAAISPVLTKDRAQIQPLDDIEHKPRQMIPRQPIPDARRQQEILVPITRQEVLRHR